MNTQRLALHIIHKQIWSKIVCIAKRALDFKAIRILKCEYYNKWFSFRWDYYDRQKHQLPGFRQLVTEGVQVEYVEPIFPSLSFPSWTTIVTGLYPSHHNILGNYMLRLADEQFPETVFQLKDNSTKMEMWWQSAEPLWITATKSGQKVYLANFANCDVPFHGVNPTECTGYQYKDVNFKLREQLNKALIRFRQGYSLAMVSSAYTYIMHTMIFRLFISYNQFHNIQHYSNSRNFSRVFYNITHCFMRILYPLLDLVFNFIIDL